MNIADFLGKLASVKQTMQGDWTARCPAHTDDSPSLSISEGKDGRILLCRHAGCTTEAICRALGLTVADLFNAKPQRNGKRAEVAAYPYTDQAGKVLFEVVRFEPKDFRQRKPDGTWSVKGVRRVPFHLPQLIAAVKAGRPVYVAEGEKDVLALEAAGLPATCNPGGAGKWLPEFARHFAGAEVVIIADKDKAGRDHAADVAGKLQGTAASVKILELPDLDGKRVKDAADYFAAGGTAADLDALAEATPPWTPEAPSLPIIARPLSELVRPAPGDAGELLKSRYLCRGAGLLLCGPTGIGKSALAMQAAILWALGRDCFGIMPAKPLLSLLIQAENDDGDLAEMRDGIFAGLHLAPSEIVQAGASVLIFREDARTSADFLGGVISPLLAEHRPDLLWIDPALAYLGGEANAQKDVGGFLRNGLNPLLRRYGCGAVVVHHTNKPPTGREKPTWTAGDFAYLGAGSAEWANWARAVLALRSIGSHRVFELRAGKRGGRLPWVETDGQTKSFARYLAHATEPGVICWREVDPEEVPQGGRPKDYDEGDLLAVLPAEGLASMEWQKLAKDECGISERNFFRQRKALEKGKKILKSKVSGRWQPKLK
jgi:hypothetical protein